MGTPRLCPFVGFDEIVSGRTCIVKHKCELHNVVCQVIIYKFIQHSAHITVQKYLYSLATFLRVLVAATTIIREDNFMDQEHYYF